MPHSSPVSTVGLDATVTDALESFSTFRGLNREDLLVLASRSEIVSAKPGQVLFSHGDYDPWMFLLLEGELSLRAKDGREHRLIGGSAEAQQIVSRLKPRLHTAIVCSPSTFIRIDGSGIGYWHAALDASTVMVEELANAQSLDAGEGSGAAADTDFELPSMPAVAIKARELIDRDDCDVDTVARLLLNDPSMAAKLIRAANSPVFYSTQGISTCDQAIVRLGFKTTRHLIIAFAVRELFDFDAPALDDLVRELWDHSTEVAAIASVLARHTRTFDPGEAQLAGLLHDIGVIPVLHAAAGQSELAADPEAVVALVAQQRATMSRELLQSWHFPPALIEASVESESWHRDTGEKADLADLVLVSQLLSFIGKHRILKVPSVLDVPAFHKVLGGETTPRHVLQFLEDAAVQIEEIQALLRT